MKEHIITDLPNFPEEVVEQFLLPFAKELGWPPGKSENDPFNRWKYILRKNDLKYWRQLKWNKEILKLSPHQLLPKDIEMVLGLIEANVNKKTNIYSMTMQDSKERFDRICTYLKNEGVYPSTVALEQIGDRFTIIDGCHRLAAYFYLLGWFKIEDDKLPCLSVIEEQEYWIAKATIKKTNN